MILIIIFFLIYLVPSTDEVQCCMSGSWLPVREAHDLAKLRYNRNDTNRTSKRVLHSRLLLSATPIFFPLLF